MKSGKPVVNPFGFTIVEVMVVLAVTLVILASAIIAINGRTQTAEFMQAVNDTQSSFQSIMNNVATGYYNTQNVYCSVTGSNPYATLSILSRANANTGNGDCMFLGEAVMFTTGNTYYGFDVLGARQDIGGSGSLSTNYSEAQPTIPNISNLVTVNSLSHELVAKWVRYTITSGGTLTTGQNTDILTFLDDPNALGTTPAPTDNTASGTIGVNVIPVTDGTVLASDPGTSGALSKAISEANYVATSTASLAQTADGNTKNPAGGVGVCFTSQSTNQSVLYTFGGNNRSTTIENQIFSGAGC